MLLPSTAMFCCGHVDLASKNCLKLNCLKLGAWMGLPTRQIYPVDVGASLATRVFLKNSRQKQSMVLQST